MRENGVACLSMIFVLPTKVIATAPVYADGQIAFEQNLRSSV